MSCAGQGYIDLEVRRVAGESDDRLKRYLKLVVSVLVTVVSFTLTCFSSHLIVTGTDPDAVMPIMSVYRLPQGQYGYSGHVANLP